MSKAVVLQKVNANLAAAKALAIFALAIATNNRGTCV